MIQALLFDVFGTVVDWRSSLIARFEQMGRDQGLSADWATLVDDWRGEYQPAMNKVRSGQREWTPLEQLHRESLDMLLSKHGLGQVNTQLREEMVRGWHFLHPWPDSVAGLRRLKQKYIIGTLSNGGLRLLTDTAKFAHLPWDVVLCSDLFRHYKPDPKVYLGAARLLDTDPKNIVMVAAHNYDLAAARSHGFKTGFVARPAEYGPRQQGDLSAEADWDLVANDFEGLAAQLST